MSFSYTTTEATGVHQLRGLLADTMAENALWQDEQLASYLAQAAAEGATGIDARHMAAALACRAMAVHELRLPQSYSTEGESVTRRSAADWMGMADVFSALSGDASMPDLEIVELREPPRLRLADLMGFDARLTRPWVNCYVPGTLSAARVYAYDESAPGELEITDGTLVIEGEDGTTLLTVSSITGTGEVTAAATLPSGTAPQRGREVWTLTPASGTLPVYTLPCIIADVSLVPALSTGDILRTMPDLTDYPGSQTSWTPQIDEAWNDVSRMLLDLADSPALWSSGAWHQVHELLAMARIHDAMAVYQPGQAYDLRAASYREEARRVWSEVRLQLDTDGDGDLDESSAPVQPRMPGLLRRVG